MIFLVKHWRLVGFGLVVSVLLGALFLQARSSDRWERRHAKVASALGKVEAELTMQKEFVAAYEQEAERQQAAVQRAKAEAAKLRTVASRERAKLSQLAPGACETPKEIMELYR